MGIGEISTRAGRHVAQPAGYRAFLPAPLPPVPPLDLGGDLQSLLSGADRALGRLDGSVLTLSNPDVFVLMYVRKEAVVLERLRQLSPRQRGQIVSRFLRAITA